MHHMRDLALSATIRTTFWSAAVMSLTKYFILPALLNTEVAVSCLKSMIPPSAKASYIYFIHRNNQK
jgi:hypothetical protein